MKPKKIRVTEPNGGYLTKEKEYYVTSWFNNRIPRILCDYGVERILMSSKWEPVYSEWEPVQEFNHGDPVWAWDWTPNTKYEGFYIGESKYGESHIVEYKDGIIVNVDHFRNIEHRKPTMTLQELAYKADVNLDEVEIVE